jgi:hypothetical protein
MMLRGLWVSKTIRIQDFVLVTTDDQSGAARSRAGGEQQLYRSETE